jgi:DNA-binding beta-propeller fold protein YncE
MKRFRRTAVAVAGAALVVVPATSASAGDGHHDGHHGGHDDSDVVTTVATGLDGPRQLSKYHDGQFVVAESDTGEVSSVDPDSGDVETLLSDLYNPQGVDYDDGLLYVALGGPPPPEEPGPPVPPGAAVSSLLVAEPGGDVLETIDLLAYELDENPDGQLQFGPNGEEYDALSNPFSVLVQDDRVLVADAGANDVLSVDPWTGDIETFFVPEVVSPDDVPACADNHNNPGTVGCDPVPTGIVEGPDGLLYVSTLGALTPDAGRVYVLDQDGNEVRVIDGLSAPTGIDVDRHGTVYVSNVIEGAPEGPPAPDFDPATVGQITRIDSDDNRSTAEVTMPTGLQLRHGDLYAAAYGVAVQVGLPAGSGEIVRVGSGVFTPVED